MWIPFINAYQDQIIFTNSNDNPNLVASLMESIKNILSDNYIIISCDIIFYFPIINDLLYKHCRNCNDVSLALNYSLRNQWKYWDYDIDNNDNILDIRRQDEITNIERYCFIVRRKVLEKYTSDFNVNMGCNVAEFTSYEEYNCGWTYLIKRLIDYGGFSVKGYFYTNPVINVNAPYDLLRAREYIENNNGLNSDRILIGF